MGLDYPLFQGANLRMMKRSIRILTPLEQIPSQTPSDVSARENSCCCFSGEFYLWKPEEDAITRSRNTNRCLVLYTPTVRHPLDQSVGGAIVNARLPACYPMRN